MNKQDKLIVALLVAALVGWWYWNGRQQAKLVAERAAVAATNTVAEAESPVVAQSPDAKPEIVAPAGGDAPAPAAEAEPPVKPQETDSGLPARHFTLSNDVVTVSLSSKGGVVESVSLRDYRRTLKSPADDFVVLDYGDSPALAQEQNPGFGTKADYTVDVSADGRTATLVATRADGLRLERTLSLAAGGEYTIAVADRYTNTSAAKAELPLRRVSLGAMTPVFDDNDSSMAMDAKIVDMRGRADYAEFDRMKALPALFGLAGGGCSAAATTPATPLYGATRAGVDGSVSWAAVRSRFFVQVLAPAVPGSGLELRANRVEGAGPGLRIRDIDLAVERPAATVEPGDTLADEFTYYVGPRKLAYLRRLGDGQDRLMRFGTWRVFCVVFLDILNFLHRIAPNYGVAIILLTVLVRLLMLPITRKGTESMRRMQQMQPKLKALQEQYKGDPQKLQRETMRLYAEYKVNPLSSCLPMLVQLPFFVALFVVLRSAVELRFEGFLWVADLSAPENLFRETLGFGVNLLPILMAVTMALQSRLTPTAGDASQQRMMMVMMPVMMLVLFYNYASGLALYWTMSQVCAILGLLWQRRRAKAKDGKGPDDPEVIAPPRETRQMRRAAAR